MKSGDRMWVGGLMAAVTAAASATAGARDYSCMKIALRRFGPCSAMMFAVMLAFGIVSAAEGAGAILHVIPAVRSNRISSVALPAEGYRIRIDAAGNANIEAADDAGRFYAEKTLAQLPHPLPRCEIEDWPSFSWRGVHLDESRHFFGKETVKRLLDRMADFKYNVFHWHLMDNQGNRIPLRSYPRMNSLGAMRSALDHCDLARGSEEFRYGPFGYTRDEIREILDFAKARHIRVMPEIEMPGHAAAVIRAYPELFCGDASDLALARTHPHSARWSCRDRRGLPTAEIPEASCRGRGVCQGSFQRSRARGAASSSPSSSVSLPGRRRTWRMPRRSRELSGSMTGRIVV